MSRKCDITGKKYLKGNIVSHSNIKTHHKRYPNLQKKKFLIGDKWIKIKVAASTIRTLNKYGGADHGVENYLSKTSGKYLSTELRKIKKSLEKEKTNKNAV